MAEPRYGQRDRNNQWPEPHIIIISQDELSLTHRCEHACERHQTDKTKDEISSILTIVRNVENLVFILLFLIESHNHINYHLLLLVYDYHRSLALSEGEG